MLKHIELSCFQTPRCCIYRSNVLKIYKYVLITPIIIPKKNQTNNTFFTLFLYELELYFDNAFKGKIDIVMINNINVFS